MAEANKGRGCFFYGCLTVAVCAVVAIVGIYIGVRYYAKKLITTYTATNGVAIAPVTLQRNQGDAVLDRVENFEAQLRAGKATGPLELNSDELDYYIRNSETWSHMRNHLHVAITNDRIEAQLSFPLEATHPTLKGRFLNGTAEFEPKVKDGVLSIDVRSVTVKGAPLPGKMLENFKKSMVWQPQGNDPNAALFNNLQSLEIRDDRIILIPKVAQTNAPPTKTP
jgi:hypothetical protein